MLIFTLSETSFRRDQRRFLSVSTVVEKQELTLMFREKDMKLNIGVAVKISVGNI